MPKKEMARAAANSAGPDESFDLSTLTQAAPIKLFPNWPGRPEDHLEAIQEALPACSLCGRGAFFHGVHIATREEYVHGGLGWVAYCVCFGCFTDRETPNRLLAHFDFSSAALGGRVQ